MSICLHSSSEIKVPVKCRDRLTHSWGGFEILKDQEEIVFNELEQKCNKICSNNEDIEVSNRNQCRNRFSDITPGSKFVKITPRDSNLDGYINANMISKYIITQNPLYNTTSDFWQMVWEYNSRIIISLIPYVSYIPEQISVHGNLIVKNLVPPTTYDSGSEDEYEISMPDVDNVVVTPLELHIIGETSTRNIHHITFKGWPDRNTPNIDDLVKLCNIKDQYNSPNMGPIVVHCMAGIGRSGCFAVYDSLRNQKYYTKDLPTLIASCIYQMRRSRKHMIQNLLQFKFLCMALSGE